MQLQPREEHLTACAVPGCQAEGRSAMFLCKQHMGTVDQHLRKALSEASRQLKDNDTLANYRAVMSAFRACAKQATERAK